MRIVCQVIKKIRKGDTDQTIIVLRRTWFLFGFLPVWQAENVINVQK